MKGLILSDLAESKDKIEKPDLKFLPPLQKNFLAWMTSSKFFESEWIDIFGRAEENVYEPFCLWSTQSKWLPCIENDVEDMKHLELWGELFELWTTEIPWRSIFLLSQNNWWQNLKEN